MGTGDANFSELGGGVHTCAIHVILTPRGPPTSVYLSNLAISSGMACKCLHALIVFLHACLHQFQGMSLALKPSHHEPTHLPRVLTVLCSLLWITLLFQILFNRD